MRVRKLVIIGSALSSLLLGGAWLWRRGVREMAAPTAPDQAAWPAPQPTADDWPWWRGPRGNGVTEGTPPLKWSLADPSASAAGDNVVWRSLVPGRGHASPVVWGSQVFLVTADDERQIVSLLSFDRAAGAQQWNCELQCGNLPKIHQKNSHASATPACDGRHVYVPFVAEDRLWMAAVTFAGEIAWKTDAGPYRSNEGFATSPAMHEGLIIVAADSAGAIPDRLHGGAAFLAALDRRSGRIVWRVRRPSADSYGTPIVAEVAGRRQLVLAGARQVSSYDPNTGDELWRHSWSADRTASTPAVDGQRVFVSATIWNNEIVCLRGDITLPAETPRVLWTLKQGAADVPSPLVVGERLYVVSDGGVLTCCSADAGRVLWKKRLRGNFAASPVAAAGRIYLVNEEGLTFVVDESGEILAENVLPEPALATPAICGANIFMRTTSALYCIGTPDTVDLTLRVRQPHAEREVYDGAKSPPR